MRQAGHSASVQVQRPLAPKPCQEVEQLPFWSAASCGPCDAASSCCHWNLLTASLPSKVASPYWWLCVIFFFSEYRRKKKLRSVLHLCEYIYLRTCSYLKGGSLNEIAIQKIWFRKRYIPAHKFYLFIKRDHQRFLINGVALSELSGVGSRRRLQLSGFSGTSWNWFCASTENVMTTIIQFWEEQESNSRWRWLGTW